jgi:hypothetical protein
MDKEWSLSVLDTFHEYCDHFVAAGKTNAGTVWVLKASKAAEKITEQLFPLPMSSKWTRTQLISFGSPLVNYMQSNRKVTLAIVPAFDAVKEFGQLLSKQPEWIQPYSPLMPSVLQLWKP